MKRKRNIFLDLDNTLVSAEALAGPDGFPFEEPGIEEKSLKFAIHDMDGYYIVFERPYVQQFLDFIFDNYNVSIWTAATKDYALFIIKNIVLKCPKRKLDYILFSHQCDVSRKQYKGSKDLQLVCKTFRLPGYTLDNTIIIDDLPEVYNIQPERAIPVKPFEILEDGSEHDDELLKIQKRYFQ